MRCILLSWFYVFISCERQGTDGVVFKTHPKNISNPRSKLLKKCGHGRIFTYFFLHEPGVFWTANNNGNIDVYDFLNYRILNVKR